MLKTAQRTPLSPAKNGNGHAIEMVCENSAANNIILVLLFTHHFMRSMGMAYGQFECRIYIRFHTPCYESHGDFQEYR